MPLQDDTDAFDERRNEDRFFARVLSTVGIATQLATLTEAVKNQGEDISEVKGLLKDQPRYEPDVCEERHEKIEQRLEDYRERIIKLEDWRGKILGALVALNLIWVAIIALAAADKIHIG